MALIHSGKLSMRRGLRIPDLRSAPFQKGSRIAHEITSVEKSIPQTEKPGQRSRPFLQCDPSLEEKN
jgi:hypothetical protein